MAQIVRSRPLRWLLVAAGFLLLGLAVVGVVVPLLPTVDFVLLAAFLFSKSSERFDRWLATNRLFGGIVRDWRSRRGFTVRSKVIATAGIVATFSLSIWWSHEALVPRLALGLLGLGLVWYVLSQPTRRTEPEPALTS